MKVYLNAEGSIIQTVPSAIPRGTTVADFEVEAPIAALAISVRFSLRGGVTEPLLLPRVSSVSSPGLNVWSAKLPYAVTEYSGTIAYQIEVQDADGYIIASPRGTLTITPGIAPVLPDNPPIDAWRAMMDFLQRIYDNVAEDSVNSAELKKEITALQKWVQSFTESRSIATNGTTYHLVEATVLAIISLWADILANDNLLSGGSLQNEEILAVNGGKHIRFTTDEEMKPILDMLKAYTNGEINGGSSIWIGPEPPPDDSYDLWIDTNDNSGGAPVLSVNGKTGAVKLSAADVGALAVADLTSAINEALAQAKASGEFDGTDGYTPKKGVDYYTPAEKVEFVSDVIAALPVYNGEVVPV